MRKQTSPHGTPDSASGFHPTPPPPSHDEIARCAHESWIRHGCPEDLDRAIWLDAEALLRAGGTCPSADYRELRRHG